MWIRRDSNSQQPECKSGALPIGATDPLIPIAVPQAVTTPTNTRNNIPSERSGTGDKDTVRLRFVNIPGINDCTFLFIPFCNPQ